MYAKLTAVWQDSWVTMPIAMNAAEYVVIEEL